MQLSMVSLKGFGSSPESDSVFTNFKRVYHIIFTKMLSNLPCIEQNTKTLVHSTTYNDVYYCYWLCSINIAILSIIMYLSHLYHRIMHCIYSKQNIKLFIHLLYKAEKPSLRPSVCPQFFGRVDLRHWCMYRHQTYSKRSARPLG